MKRYDVIIIGGGPGGSTAGTYLAKAGYKVAIFERENYPRFHIGESLLPASMPIFKETGFYETLSSGRYIKKYGARFVDYKTDDEIYFGFEDGFNPDIPMAYEVPRAQFDRDILEHAAKCGVEIHQPERVKDVVFTDDFVKVITSQGEYEATFLLDSSGRDAFLGKRMKARQMNRDLNNVAVFSHFTGVKRAEGKHEGDIIIGLLPDRAWSWLIPFKGETTSIGVVCSSTVFNAGTDLSEYLDKSFNSSNILRKMTEESERSTEVTVISNYSHTTEVFHGDRWILAGDAAVFLDPIFSSGVHVSITSGKLAAQTLMQALDKKCTLNDNGMGEAYRSQVLKGVNRFHKLISMFYVGDFVQQMKKTLTRENVRKGFTSAVAGDVWNDENFLFQKNIL